MAECEVYSYAPSDADANPLSSGALWSFNYFFVNRGLNRCAPSRWLRRLLLLLLLLLLHARA
jgi:hypothetical protein